jgi:hypothetical protein
VAAKTYRCVGGPFDGRQETCDGRRVRLEAAPDGSREGGADYDVRRLMSPDGRWHEFLVLSSWTSMQAAVWLNRRPR